MTPRILRDLIVEYRPNPARLTYTDAPILHPRDAAAILIPLLRDQPQEVLGAIYLDTRGRVIAYREISRGTIHQCLVQPRDVIIPGLLINAAQVLIAHNHPSGDPTPSPDDCALTRQLVEACSLIGVPLRDHLIIGDDQYVSFQETGRM